MTDADTLLWERLSCYPRPLSFRRQHIIGDYTVDFVCMEKMLVVEVDGEYHSTDEQKALDELRTEYLNSVDFSVVRFTNEQVINHINDVVAHIEELIYK